MITLSGTVLECKDTVALAAFYKEFLGWNIDFEGEGFVILRSPDSTATIAFQRDFDYIPPVWPTQEGRQQMMEHIDFNVKDKEEMDLYVEKAVSLGARIAEEQYGGDKWITMIDPAGHPFDIERRE